MAAKQIDFDSGTNLEMTIAHDNRRFIFGVRFLTYFDRAFLHKNCVRLFVYMI